MTDSHRYPIIKSKRLVALMVFALIITAISRKALLPILGYVDMGWARWIFTGSLTFVFMIFALLVTRHPFGLLFANGPRPARIAYAVLFLLTASAFFWACISDFPFTSPMFFVPTAVGAVLGAFEWRAERRLAKSV